MAKKLQSRRKSYFKFMWILFAFLILVLIYIKTDIYITEKSIKVQTNMLEDQNRSLETSQNKGDYIKLAAVKRLENEQKTIPWSEHIPKVIQMLESIKKVDPSSTESVVLL